MTDNFISLNVPNVIALNVIWLGSFAAVALLVQLWRRKIGQPATVPPLSLVSG